MAGTPDPVEAKLDRILGQLTTITNRLNSHDARLARIESGKPDAGKGEAGGDDATHGGAAFNRTDGDGSHEDRDTYGAHETDRDRAWAEFRERALRDRERYEVRRGPARYEPAFYDRGGRDYDSRGAADHREFPYGDRDFDRGGREFDRRGADRDFDRGGRDFDHPGRDFPRPGRIFPRPGRDFDCGHCLDGRRELHRPPKIPFPSFNGESDPLTWLNKCDNYFWGHLVPEDEKVWQASLRLEDTAAEWYYQMEHDFGMVSWPRFVEFINLRFGPPIRSNSVGEIKALIRTGTVEEYSRRFLALLSRCDDLSTRTAIDLYTSGLGQPLASDVEIQHPVNLQQAMSLARKYEQRQIEASTVNSSAAPKSSTRRATASSSAAGSGGTLQDSKQEGTRSLFRRLTQAEMQEKRQNGQCYFCPEPYSKDHKCAAKGVFLGAC